MHEEKIKIGKKDFKMHEKKIKKLSEKEEKK
jgi:hypothetical protein